MTTAQKLKEQVRAFWDEAPCGTRELAQDDEGTRFAELERMRNEREPFIARFARLVNADQVEVDIQVSYLCSCMRLLIFQARFLSD